MDDIESDEDTYLDDDDLADVDLFADSKFTAQNTGDAAAEADSHDAPGVEREILGTDDGYAYVDNPDLGDAAEADSHDAPGVARDTSGTDDGYAYMDNPDLGDAVVLGDAVKSLMNSIVESSVNDSITPETTEQIQPRRSTTTEVDKNDVFGTSAKLLMDSIIEKSVDAPITPETTERKRPSKSKITEVNMNNVFGNSAKSLMDSIVENSMNALITPETTERMRARKSKITEVNMNNVFGTSAKSFMDLIVENSMDTLTDSETTEQIQTRENSFAEDAEVDRNTVQVDENRGHVDDSSAAAVSCVNVENSTRSKDSDPAREIALVEATQALLDDIVKTSLQDGELPAKSADEAPGDGYLPPLTEATGTANFRPPYVNNIVEEAEDMLNKSTHANMVVKDENRGPVDDSSPASHTNVENNKRSKATEDSDSAREIALVEATQALLDDIVKTSLQDGELPAKSADEAVEETGEMLNESTHATVVVEEAIELLKNSAHVSSPENTSDADHPQLDLYAKSLMDEIIHESMQELKPPELPNPQSVNAKRTTAVPDNMEPGTNGDTEAIVEALPPGIPDLAPDATDDDQAYVWWFLH